MKKVRFMIVVLTFCYVSGSSQSCLPEGIYFATQAQIDSFQINNPGCTNIEGNVKIEGEDITNLNGLNVLTSIGEDLLIQFNPNLVSLTGLHDLTSIGGNLAVAVNNILPGLTGLDSLTSLEGGLYIVANTTLASLTGLDNLAVIGGDLEIGENTSLTSLSPLGNMTSVGRDLWIWDNDVLTSLTGLNNLTSIEGELGIAYHDALTSLIGMENIEAESISDLFIFNNASLAECEAESVCAYLSSPNGVIEIHDNAIGCNSPEEVQDSCEAHAGIYDDIYFKSKLALYPIPAYQEVKVSLNDGREIDEVIIYTLTGQQILQDRPVNGTIDISTLKPGMYIVEVTVEGRRMRRKLLVE